MHVKTGKGALARREKDLILVLSIKRKTTLVLLLGIQMLIALGTWTLEVQHLDMYSRLMAAVILQSKRQVCVS